MDSSRQFYIAALIIALLAVSLSIYITKAFISAILLGIFLTYLISPLYTRLLRKIKNRQISALLTLTIVSIISLILLLFVANAFLSEISNIFEPGSQSFYETHYLHSGFIILADRYLPDAAAGYISNIPEDIVTWLIPILSSNATSFAINIPVYIAQLVVAIFVTYYLLTDGSLIVNRARELLPEKTVTYNFIVELNSIYNTLFRIHFITSLVAGAIAALGFFILGVPYPILWGITVALFDLIPELGPSAVYVPMALYYFLIQNFVGATAIFIFGTIFLVIIPDNLIRPRLALMGASVHPLITIMAFTAPVFVLGISGIIAGPAIYGFVLALFRTAICIRQAQCRSREDIGVEGESG
jgi:predicted PurR-regulated permease PerM